MKHKRYSLIISILLISILANCTTLAESVLTPTPADEKPKQTSTPTFTPVPRAQFTNTPTPEALVLPSPFDITLQFTNGTCGSGTPSYPYTFTIDGSSLTLLQVDAEITTTGSYDSVTGAFSTSGAVGTGTETYDGIITFDGATITIIGSSSYVDASYNCANDIEGTTTIP